MYAVKTEFLFTSTEKLFIKKEKGKEKENRSWGRVVAYMSPPSQ